MRKVNEAPEKIYVHVKNDKVTNTWNSTFIGVRDIEYTRTDAFIEKLESYLNSQLYDWVSITNPDQRSCANVIPKKDFIEDFRNYMKGE